MNTTELLRFLDAGVSSLHVAREITARFEQAGFRRLSLGEQWMLEPGQGVLVEQGGTVVAFRAGTSPPAESGILAMAAHTDSPGLQLKLRSARFADGLLQVPVEVYGGPILATWLDRELSLAGVVVARNGNAGVDRVLVRSPRTVAVIPNLAIHLNREVNENLHYNQQEHLQALFPGVTAAEDNDGPAAMLSLLGQMADLDPGDIVDAQVFLLPSETAHSFGRKPTLVVSPRIDNLAGCFPVMEALRTAPVRPHGALAVFFNHEEIGSNTNVGAAGGFLDQVLHRLVLAHQSSSSTGALDTFERAMARTVLISNDAAHARHPNYREKHDPGYAPWIGGGPVIKRSATWRYLGDAAVAGWFRAVCESLTVPVQELQSRSDMRAGSTIGPAVATRFGVRGVDVGIPMLAMHSARETAAVDDVAAMTTVLTEIFERTQNEVLDPPETR